MAGAGLILGTIVTHDGGFLSSGKPTVRWIEGSGVGGEIDGGVGRVTALRIGRAPIDQPVTMFTKTSGGAFALPDMPCDIGAAIREKSTVTLDYSRGRIIIAPNATSANRRNTTAPASRCEPPTQLQFSVLRDGTRLELVVHPRRMI